MGDQPLHALVRGHDKLMAVFVDRVDEVKDLLGRVLGRVRLVDVVEEDRISMLRLAKVVRADAWKYRVLTCGRCLDDGSILVQQFRKRADHDPRLSVVDHVPVYRPHDQRFSFPGFAGEKVRAFRIRLDQRDDLVLSRVNARVGLEVSDAYPIELRRDVRDESGFLLLQATFARTSSLAGDDLYSGSEASVADVS